MTSVKLKWWCTKAGSSRQTVHSDDARNKTVTVPQKCCKKHINRFCFTCLLYS